MLKSTKTLTPTTTLKIRSQIKEITCTSPFFNKVIVGLTSNLLI